MIQTTEQFQKAAAALRANPPEITSRLAVLEDGKWCHCALGVLGVAAGVPPEKLDYHTIVEPLRREFGLDTSLCVGSKDDYETVAGVIYGANDYVQPRRGTPEQRAEVVIESMKLQLLGKEQFKEPEYDDDDFYDDDYSDEEDA